MPYCSACAKNTVGNRDSNGFLSCDDCGKVLTFDNYSTEATFVKNSAGQSQLAGRLVRSIDDESFSRQRLFDRALDDLIMMKNGLGMGENLTLANQALDFYRIAVERGFTRGRRTEQVQAACLYIACRENRKPYLLIDFSNYLHINVYVLGAVFLQLCQVLHLTEHPICQKLHDPSIFIHKYTASLTNDKSEIKEISDTALAIIASMNRDWMQTGRRPSGLWGAALYIAAYAYGHKPASDDILRLVHVCGATLSKRLVEFENTESSALTIDELNAKAEELMESPVEPSSGMKERELLCKHKGISQHYAHGLCKSCHSFVIGFDGGSDPPAFQKAERQRMEKMEKADDRNTEDQDLYREEITPLVDQGTVGISTADIDEGGNDERSKGTDDDGSDNFSDIDDDEVNEYLHSESEKPLKKELWEAANWEYLEEQAAKEADAAALKEAQEANLENCSPEARERYAAVLAAMEKSKKEKQKKRAADAKNSTPAQTAEEAVHRMFTKKRLGSKINFTVLDMLFEETVCIISFKLSVNALKQCDREC
ncbi:unnamed protein product [Linum tenue]|uniref:Transcription factor IIIB 90 kDa subunit n=1 Tax=Linum tenue TaxID=586396 RepID=A0AAV0H6G5_9ROSI|nr:unnamed protein product [Linum tenue]